MASAPSPTESSPLLGPPQGDGPNGPDVSPETSARSRWASVSPRVRLLASWARHQKRVKSPNLQQWFQEKFEKAKRTLTYSAGCYSLSSSHCEMDTNMEGVTVLGGYEVQKLTTMRVFLVATGTVLESPLLWVEMAVIALIYFATFTIMMAYRWEGFAKFVGNDTEIRAFISMFSTLIGLLLSFYTSLNISRWWSLRTRGIEGISQGASNLTILLSQGVTRNENVLSAVRRYALASLMLFFLKDEEDKVQLDKLVEREVLTQDEADQLSRLGSSWCYPDSLWVWLANIVTKCNDAGLVKGPPHYCALLAAVDEGRTGASTIKTYLETPIPMGYVHLLGLMVKLHNLTLALLMALLSVKHASAWNPLSTSRVMFRCFFMPFLYNALLIINDELTDPFGQDVSDFPAHVICRRFNTDVQSFVGMGDNLPDWVNKLDLKKEGGA